MVPKNQLNENVCLTERFMDNGIDTKRTIGRRATMKLVKRKQKQGIQNKGNSGFITRLAVKISAGFTGEVHQRSLLEDNSAIGDREAAALSTGYSSTAFYNSSNRRTTVAEST